MIRRSAACASGVTVSASSRMMILNGGLGYVFSVVSPSTSMASSLSDFFLKKDAALPLLLDGTAFPDPTAKLAKCLILSRTTEMPRSSLAFNSRTRRRH